jgi:hypothetical protein
MNVMRSDCQPTMSLFQRRRQNTSERIETRENRDEELDGLAALNYHERLTHFVRGSTRHSVKGSITVVDFRPLYAITVHHFQRQIAQEIQLFLTETTTDGQLSRLRHLLEGYSALIPQPCLLSLKFRACSRDSRGGLNRHPISDSIPTNCR